MTEFPPSSPYRLETILDLLKEANISLDGIDACVGRGGGLIAMGGRHLRNRRTALDHATRGANGVQHPAQLGPQLAHAFAQQYNCPAFVVNPPDVDELQDLARLTGLKGIHRNVHLHSLNLKETAIRHAQSQGKKYEEQNYVVCHIGGGISVSAHRQGKMVDGFDIVGGEGPMAPHPQRFCFCCRPVKICRRQGSQKKLKAFAQNRRPRQPPRNLPDAPRSQQTGRSRRTLP